MVELAANLPRRFGFAPTVAELYSTPEERIKARSALFELIDTGKGGYVSPTYLREGSDLGPE